MRPIKALELILWLLTPIVCKRALEEGSRTSFNSLQASNRVISVESLSDVVNHLVDTQPRDNRDIIYYVSSSKSFLTKADSSYLDGVTYSLGSRNQPHNVYHKLSKNYIDQSTLLVQFRLFVEDSSEFRGLSPISNCHEEKFGEGGLVEMQTSFGLSMSMALTLGISPNILVYTLSLSTKLSTEMTRGESITVSCEVQHGETTQVFLKGAKRVQFRAEHQMLSFDSKSRNLRQYSDKSTTALDSYFVRSDFSEIVCATDAVTNLKCSRTSLHAISSLGDFT